MKGLALCLGFSFAVLQPILIIDCPCDLLCGHKNAFESSKNAQPDDCCTRSAAGRGQHPPESSEDRCFHVEPQTELDSLAPGIPADSPLCLGIVPACFTVPRPDLLEAPPPTGLPPPARGRPLYLQFSSLLI